ncbi:putative insulin-like peptide receptor, partial [Apostichopus japonicus]
KHGQEVGDLPGFNRRDPRCARDHPGVLSHTLSFLKNLRVIGGVKDLERGLYSVYVLDNRNLQDLFVTPHQNFSITRGKVFFHFNPKLCYHKIQEFAATGGLSANLSTGDVSRNTNGDFVACSALKINLTLKAVGSIILVTWQEDKVGAIADRRSILGFVVSWRVADKNVTQFDGEESCGGSLWDSTYTEPTEYQLLLPGLNAATRYAMYVRSYMISGTENGVKSDIKYIVTPERAPSAPTSLLIQAVSSSKLRVMWGPPDEPNGNVTRYKLKWTKQVDASYGSVDFCIGKIPNSNPREDTTTERTDIIEEWDGDCNCSCEGGKDLKDADEVRNQITFENALHNIIFIKRPQRSKREVDSTQSPVGNVVIDDKSSSPNTTAPSQTDGNGTTAAANVSDPRPVVNEAEVIMNDEFMIVDLGHFEQIMVEVVACNLEGCSEQSTVVFGRTLPKENADDIVSGIALNITDQKIKEHVILARWEPPPHSNGVVLKYEVEVVEEVKPKTVETVTFATASPEAGINSTSQEQIQGGYCISAFAFTEAGGFTFTLRNSGNFSVRVRAVTLAGNGNWTRSEPLNVPSIDEVLPPKAPIVQQIPWIVGALAFIILGICLMLFFRYQYRKDQTPDVVLYASANPEYFSTNDMYVPDDWEFPREKLTVVNELGKGGFGMVYEGIAQEIIPGEEKTTVAVKSVQANASVRDRIEFLNEASVMKNIKTHHVVHLLGVVSKGQPTYVIMEFMAQGDLKNWLRARRPENQQDLPLMERKHPPTYPEVIKMAAEIADGMAYLGANKYVHRDLSARNCLVSEDGTCKVADFGLARDIYQSDYYRKERGGMLPIRWMAPESVKDGVFTTSSDVWSYGILLWEIASLGEMPYGGLNNEGAGEFVKQGRVLNMPEGCPEKLQELMMACWTFQEKLRPTFSDIVMSLESTGFLPLNFPLVSFFHGEERVVEQRANGSLEELERVNMLPQPGMNDYTYMDKGNPDEGNRFPETVCYP